MLTYIVRRVLWIIPVLFFVSIITFLLMHAVPGGPWSRERPLPAATIERLNAKYGLDEPIVVQYLNWVGPLAIRDGEVSCCSGLLTGDLGPSAWLRHRGVNVVVVSGRVQPLDQAFARSLGIDCGSMRYITVKSAVHFRSGFEGIAGSIHNIDAQAIHSHDFARLPYRRRRPMYPVEPVEGLD